MLQIKNLSVIVDGKTILSDLSLQIKSGELHVLMGPNGSGKSTLGYALAGKPGYEVSSSPRKAGSQSSINLDGNDVTKISPEDRAKAGLFLAFQQPVGVPGVKITNFLRLAYNAKKKQEARSKKQELGPLEFYKLLKEKAAVLEIPDEFLGRTLNDQFSGGEKKRLEMLQALVLEPKYALLDEPDTGTDVDTLKLIARAINLLQKNGTGILLVTHYQRLLKYLKSDQVHVLKNGRIVVEGGKELITQIEKHGYANL